MLLGYLNLIPILIQDEIILHKSRYRFEYILNFGLIIVRIFSKFEIIMKGLDVSQVIESMTIISL